METKNIAFFSTNALEGHAKAIVIRTGSNTFMGQLASLASNLDSGPSPIQKEMARFVMIMTVRSLLFGGSFFAIAMAMGYDW
jgi:sodium/potassium-transporting ATPase subunit alpha